MKKRLIPIYERFVRPIIYRIREWWPLWFHILNREPRKLFAAHPISLDSLQSKIVATLKSDGIATISLNELFPGQELLEILRAYESALPPVPEDLSWKKKKFLEHRWAARPKFDESNPFVALTLNDRVINIVNGYMEMWTKLKYYDLALTKTVPPGTPPSFSQGWHRDPEEKRMCKVFIYLSDVDENSGPFTYVPGSVYGQEFGNLFPQKPPAGCYPPEEDVLRSIPSDRIKLMTAPAGTVIFCDTTGIHRGGYATKNERLMFTAFFSSPRYSEKRYYSVETSPTVSLSPAATYAISAS